MRPVSSKLQPPSLRGNVVKRSELLRRLDDAVDLRVCLICAPAGFGKTWLAADWLEYHSDIAQVWVRLDARDNDPARLWQHLVEGIRREIPDAGLSGELLSAGRVNIDFVVDRVVAALEECRESVVLIVLDDVHVIQDQEATASLERLIEEMPRSTHLVLLARRDPMVRLTRWRMSQELAEIRGHDLQLTSTETSQLIADNIDRSISDEVALRVHQQMAGWVAGVQVAVLVANGAEDPEAELTRLRGARGDIADLVANELLAGLEPDIRTFLLKTSVLGELCGELCDAVTGGVDGADVLEGLVRAGLFTVATEEYGGWYRYHDLLREVLQIELRRTDPSRFEEVHRLAARWCHDFGDPALAVHHALAGGEADLAADWLVEASSGLLRSGQGRTLIKLATEIDAAIGESRVDLLFALGYAAWSENALDDETLDLVVQRAFEAATLRDADANWKWPGFPLDFEGKEDLLAVITGHQARRRGDPEAVLAIHEAHPGACAAFRATLAEALIWLGRYAEASPHAAAYVDTAHNQGDPNATKVRGLGLAAMVAVGEGRLADAQRIIDRVGELERNRLGGPSAQSTYAEIAGAWVAWEQGALDVAGKLAASALARSGQRGTWGTYVQARLVLARTLWSQGDRGGAGAALDDATVLPSGRLVTGHFAEQIAIERARMALLDGDTAAAEFALPDWSERVERGATTPRETLTLCRYVVAAGGDPHRMLKRIPDGSESTLPNRIEVGILRAQEALRDTDRDRALDVLTEAMRLAAVYGHRQRFLDERHSLGALLDNAAARAGVQLLTGDHDSMLNGDRDGREPTETEPLDLAEPLTSRELEVLRLLPSHRSYRQIGDDLGLSINTVKYHVKSIYRKLEAHGRAEAVRRAERSGLVPR